MITWLYDFDKLLTTNYLTYLFAMSGFRKQIDSLQAGSTVAYLSISMTKKLDIMLPPIDLQNEFATFVEQTDKLKFDILMWFVKFRKFPYNTCRLGVSL